MKIKEFDYCLPKNFIAQEPVYPRDNSRLLVVNRRNKSLCHHYFYEIDRFLKKGDILVLNKTKVIPARLLGKKYPTGGKVEVLLLLPDVKNLKRYTWSNKWLIVGRPNLKKQQKIEFPLGLKGEIVEILNDKRIIRFNKRGGELRNLVYKIGKAPTPPYIKSKFSNFKLKKQYQTIYAERIGSVAAPTAGFHFTKKLIKKLQRKGIEFQYVILHIGLGTFQPIRVQSIKEHRIEEEWVEIGEKTAMHLNKAKEEKRRIIAVGTTTTRALEAFSGKKGYLKAGKGFVNLFIYPGYKFKFIDALITNFHLPKSTLLMLVCAFAKKSLIFKAYKEAIKKKYRFYSFGDAMFIL